MLGTEHAIYTVWIQVYFKFSGRSFLPIVVIVDGVGVATISVSVWGVPCEVITEQISKGAWTAAGTYVFAFHTTKGQTEGSAVKRWTEWASYYRDEGFY